MQSTAHHKLEVEPHLGPLVIISGIAVPRQVADWIAIASTAQYKSKSYFVRDIIVAHYAREMELPHHEQQK